MDEEALRQWADVRHERAKQLMEANPLLNPMTAIIMAGDAVAADEASQRVADGEDPLKAMTMVGSFSRFLWAWDHLLLDDFFDRIAELWRGSDPDDSDPRMIQIWMEASAYFEHRLITDEQKELPRPGKGHLLKVYRGEEDPSATAPSGIAFSLDPLVARKFAMGAGSRTMQHGVVLTCNVDPGDVLAYITGRNEEELIIAVQDVIVRSIS